MQKSIKTNLILKDGYGGNISFSPIQGSYEKLTNKGYTANYLGNSGIYIAKENLNKNYTPCDNFNVIGCYTKSGTIDAVQDIYSHKLFDVILEISPQYEEKEESKTLLGYKIQRVYYKDDVSIASLEQIVEALRKDLIFESFRSRDHNINLVVSTHNGYDFQEVRVNPKKVDIDKHYKDDFKEIDEIIRKSLSKKETGIILLHGTPGTGKTNYIKSLCNQKGRSFVYIPSDMIGFITHPAFITEMINLKNPVIVLEDCEEYLKDRKNSSNNSFVTTLLNLGDGILSDIVECLIICTFNNSITDLDPALLRKGRLLCEYEFGPLEKEKAQVIADEIGVTLDPNEKMTLANIYGSQATQIRKSKQPSKIGF